MLRGHYNRTAPHDVEELRKWSTTKIAVLWDMICLLLFIGIAGAVVLFFNDREKEARRQQIDDRLMQIACLTLHYLPPTQPFSKDLRTLYPDCPPYVPLYKKSESKASNPVPSVTIVMPSVTAVTVPSGSVGTPTRTDRVTTPAPQPTPTRTITRPPVTKTATQTVPAPSPSESPGPVCTLVGPLCNALD